MLPYERVHLQRKIMLMHQPLGDYDTILKRRGEERTRGGRREERWDVERSWRLKIIDYRIHSDGVLGDIPNFTQLYAI